MALEQSAAKVDRQTTTPFLLKLFYRTTAFHRLDEFTPAGALPPHLQIYTWPTCTLRELTHLLTSALPNLIPSPSAGTRVAFRLVFPDTRQGPPQTSNAPARYLTKDLGSVVVGGTSAGAGPSENAEETNGNGAAHPPLDGEADRMLQDARFVIGDYVSCVVLPPLADGSVAPSPAPSAGAGRGGGGGGGGFGPPRGGYRGARDGGGFYGAPRDAAYGEGYRSRAPRGGFAGEADRGVVPSGEWRRGERVPDGPGGYARGSYGRSRGRGW